MKKTLIFLIILLSIVINIIAQENSDNNCSIRILNEQTEKSVNRYLQRQKALINILVAKDCKFLNDSLFITIKTIDFIRKNEICENIFQSVDSIIVLLENGIAWNLNNEPPKQPKRFYLKIFSKKWCDDQAVIDWGKFLKFCSQFDNSNDNPCKVNDIYNVYTQIKYNEKIVFLAVYEIDLKANPKRFDLISLEEFQNGLDKIIK